MKIQATDAVGLIKTAGDTMTGPLMIDTTGAALIVGGTVPETLVGAVPTLQIQAASPNTPTPAFIRWDSVTAANSPSVLVARSRGAVLNSRGIVQNGDRLGQILMVADDGVNFISAAAVRAEVDGTPGVGDMPTRLLFLCTADGTASPAEVLRLSSAAGMSMYGANTVIDENRLFNLRQYTVATLPTPGIAGRLAAVTNALAPAYNATVVGGGAVRIPVYDNGTNWVAH